MRVHVNYYAPVCYSSPLEWQPGKSKAIRASLQRVKLTLALRLDEKGANRAEP